MKFKLFSLYMIDFLDHSIGTEENVMCRAVGWVVEESEDFLILCHWDLLVEDQEMRKDNQEKVKILKSAIRKKRKLSANT